MFVIVYKFVSFDIILWSLPTKKIKIPVCLVQFLKWLKIDAVGEYESHLLMRNGSKTAYEKYIIL